MLIQRIVTALLLLPLVLGTVWFGSTEVVGAVFGAAALVAVLEWGVLTGVDGAPGHKNWTARALYLLAAAVLIAAVVALRRTPLVWVPAVATCLWWLLMVRWILVYPGGRDAGDLPRWLMAGAGLVVIPGTIAAVCLLHGAPEGPLRLLFAFFLIWAADVGAYFAGRAFGRHKLAPNVSPGKTWEGVWGGLLLALAIAGIAGIWLFELRGAAWLPFLLLSAGAVLFSIIGDLGESLIKRQAGAKDSGTLLPGHGGVLDRVDSILAALPALAIGLYWLGL